LSFDILPETEKLSDIKGLEKLVSHEGCYKIRAGDYRVGIQIDFERGLILCCRVLHRKEIYRYYP
jgi:mRNA-degrading endonuclease RelE of RelBE toxin-antitoxin system